MLQIIIITILTIYICAFFIASKILNKEEKIDIVKVMLGITLVTSLITYVVFKISQGSIAFENEEVKDTMSNILIYLFIGLNLLINLPIVSRLYVLKKEKGMNNITKSIIIFLVINVIVYGAEINYLNGIQTRILDITENVVVENIED